MHTRSLLLSAVLSLAASYTAAQPPEGRRGGPPDGNPASFVDRMLAFDKNNDGKLSKDEVTDERLGRLFDRADANKDGTVTKDELTALAAREASGNAGRRRRPGPPGSDGPPPGGPGGFGGPPPGGPPGFMGQVLPPPIQERLGLSSEQRAKIAELQKEVDAKLEKILTKDQSEELAQLRTRRPGAFGRPGGGPPGDGPPGRFGEDGPPRRRGPGGGPPGRGGPPPPREDRDR